MRFRSLVLLLFILFTPVAVLFCEKAIAQAPGQASKPAPRAGQTPASLAQLMRGILFPNSNVIFAAQSQDPSAIKPDAEPTQSPNPLTSSFGGWQAVENSSLALEEAATLLTIPGRLCSNGRPVPIQNADWAKFVQGLRDAGAAAYKAAQSKNQDKILDAADVVTTACANCHNVYREKTEAQGGLKARCKK